MSFATELQAFAAQAARERVMLSPATIQPYTGTGAATADGRPLTVFLSAVKAEQEITDNGFVVIHKAQLRVPKTLAWTPAEGLEFVNTATAERFRIRTATGAASNLSAEIVCEVIKIAS